MSKGVRLPQIRPLADFFQWSRTIDLLHKLEINVVLDVGANRGFYAKHLRASGYEGQIICFEPIPEDADRIRDLAGDDSNWTVCSYALGDESSTKEFSVNRIGSETLLSSFLPLRPNICSSEVVKVEMRRLDDVLPALIKSAAEPRLFLKMDTQGFDLRVVEGGLATMPNVLGLQSEVSVVPLYEGMPHFTDAIAGFEKLGFGLLDLFLVNRASNGLVVEYDCLMARPEFL
jgi:FkbM family methyltransferase